MKNLKLKDFEKAKCSEKYSNDNLFVKRDFSSKSRVKNYSNFSEYKKSLPMLTQTTFRTSHRNESLSSIYNPMLTQTNFSDFLGDTFLTESKKTVFPSFRENNSNFNNTNLNWFKDIKKEINDCKILKVFEESTKLKEKPKNNLIDKKIKKFQNKKENVNEYINKTRDVLLLNYTMNIKKERTIRLNEQSNNEKETVDGIIKSLKNTNELFNYKFYTKFCEYVKYLEIQREIEKNINSDINESVLKLKLEISQIQNKIRAIEYDKNNYFKWLYFQIGVKEKKLELPDYYKYILEENEYIFQQNLEILSTRVSQKKSSPEIIRRSLIKKDTFVRKKVVEKKQSAILSFDNNTNYHNFFAKYKSIPKKEIVRIRKYIYEPIFNSAEEFLETFSKIKNNTIKLLNEYSSLKQQIWELINERNKFQNETLKELETTEKYIEVKEKELNIQKNKKVLLKKEIHKLKYIIKNILKKKVNKKKSSMKISKIFEIPKLMKKEKPVLKNSVEKVYQTCLQVKIEELNQNDNETKFYKKQVHIEILEKIFKIERVIDYLMNKIEYYKSNQTNEDYKKIQIMIDKSHKKEKARLLKEIAIEKYNLLTKRVEERKNKFYFLNRIPLKNYIKYSKKRPQTSSIQKYHLTEITVKDFLYDNESKNYSSEFEEEFEIE